METVFFDDTDRAAPALLRLVLPCPPRVGDRVVFPGAQASDIWIVRFVEWDFNHPATVGVYLARDA